MAVKKFLIAPQDKGFETRYKSWLISDKAYERLRNAYTWRGSVKKRFGAAPMNMNVENPQLFTRLRVNIGTTNGAGALGSTIVPGANFAALGKLFSCGDELYTVTTTGVPAATLTTGSGTATYNTTTGAFALTGGPAATDVFYYPSTPVMHFGIYNVVAVNDETTFAFDTQFAYTFTYATGWNRETGTAANNTWTGTDSDFFWTTNYRGADDDDFILFVTNNVAADAMRYWDGTDWNAFGSVGTTPIDNDAADFIKTCKIIEPFKGRLLLFNVTENIGASDKVYRNRIRYSAEGSPFAATAWNQDIVGGGNYVEIPIKESIISVNFIKDRCIVFCESSTWELVYTGNKNLPFVPQQLDAELGVESMNSVIPFDKVSLSFGNVGIHACNGLNVERVDELIPTTIFEVNNDNNGPQRVAGIRDYYNELAYWSYNSIDSQDEYNQTYPNRVLVYNYAENNWAYNDDSITALGYYQITQDLTWNTTDQVWQALDIPWDDPSTQNRFRSIIGGNQEGFTFLINTDYNTNSIGLQITNISISGNVLTLTIYNHNLSDDVNTGDYIYIENVSSTGTLEDDINNTIFFVDETVDANTIKIVFKDGTVPTGTYAGGGVIIRVSAIDILTKQYNFFYDEAANMAINQIDFYVDKSSNGFDGESIDGEGQITVDYFVSSASNSMLEDGETSGALLGTSILETTPYALVPLEQAQNRFWHSLYPIAFGENIQLRFYWTDEQIRQKTETSDGSDIYTYVAFQDFQLNAMLFYAEPVNPIGG